MHTRRCSERRFFLRPDPVTNNTYWYCLGWAAQKHGIVLHAAVAMSNHDHIAGTDTNGMYPDFLRDFHGLLARAMNAHRGRWEHFWDSNQASVVALEDEAAQLDKVVYILANPVKVVGKAAVWPGPTALHSILNGKPIVANKPKHFFRSQDRGGSMPDTVSITFVQPPALAHLSRAAYMALLRERIAVVERDEAAERKRTGRKVLGRDQILAQHWNDRPRNAEPRRQLIPTVACRDKWRRIERLLQRKAFLAAYREAREAFRRGLPAIFPFGTWLLRFHSPIEVSTA